MADERQNKKRRKPDRHIDGSTGIPTKHAGGGDYPAFRQSPFQRIVDVNWAGGEAGLAEQALLGTNPAPSFLSTTGVEWTDSTFETIDPPTLGGGITTMGASGDTFTVTIAYGWIVYGEPEDGEPCFIAVTPCGGVYRGVEDEDTTVWTYVCGLNNLPLAEFYGYGFNYSARICGISFAGGKFFIGLASGNSVDPVFLACSSDGESWQFVKIFADVRGLNGEGSEDNYGSVYSGNVAYNSDTGMYCITGTVDATFEVPAVPPSVYDKTYRNTLFVWDTSSDGLNWAGGSFDHSSTAPGNAMGNMWQYGNIAFGNGTFVAVGSKCTSPFPPDNAFGSLYNNVAAAAVSSDGNAWTPIVLPGAAEDIAAGDPESSSNSSMFIAYVTPPSGEGFFFTSGRMLGGPLPVLHYLWTSPDGTEWTRQSTGTTDVNYDGTSVVSDPAGTVVAFPACAGDNHDGAVFVSGDRAAQIRYARMVTKDSPQDWIAVGDSIFTDTPGVGQILSGAYAKIDGTPTFVFGGNGNRGESTAGDIGIIMVSHDGLAWSDALLKSNASVNAMVWDVNDKHFYADVHDLATGEQPYRSPDGINWTPVTDGTYTLDHCHNFLPYEDGWYSYDIYNDLLIEPYSSGQAKVTTKACFGPTDIIYTATGLYSIECTVYAGGIWIAGGNTDSGATSCTAASTDNGEIWTVVSTGKLGMAHEGQIEVVLGAPIEDFS